MSLPHTIAKLIDTSSCIGCKACEVACQEWNDQEFTFGTGGSYPTLPDLAHNFWNLIKFNETEYDGRMAWNMAKYQCMHCVDPGCLRACPAPGAIVVLPNGTVDFNHSTILDRIGGEARSRITALLTSKPVTTSTLARPESSIRMRER